MGGDLTLGGRKALQAGLPAQVVDEAGCRVQIGLLELVQLLAAHAAAVGAAVVDVVPFGIHRQVFGDGVVGGLALRRRVLGAARRLLEGLEHEVGFQHLRDLLLQVQRRQLQHADGLLQGGRHRQ